MGYIITRYAGDKNQFLKLPRAKYDALRAARENLLVMLNIEEKLTLLLENYVEFENELLSRTLTSVVFRVDSWSAVISEIHAYNRRIVNLLTLCRLYFDQLQHDLNTIYGRGSEIPETVEAARRNVYASSFGYRVMEALRNYVQHRGLPIDSIQHSMQWKSRDPEDRTVMSTIVPYLKVSKFKDDSRFKRSVLTEMERMGESLDVRPLVREYVEGIGRVHEMTRGSTRQDVERWDTLLQNALKRFTGRFGGDPQTLALVARLDDLETGEVQIFNDLIARRQWLQRRTAHLTHYSMHIVTNEVRAGDQTIST